jgi:cell division septum initiation protein DivIVA
MNIADLKKNSKEELIIYIEKLSRDMTKIQEENLELRKENQQMQDYINQLDSTNKFEKIN